ncbi:hypothetical protein OQE43_10680 [Bacillus velezensis]|uniref:hypothetical protein n=1 Tax=Bacillus velezensis TaxID=492670 RepID=UPI00224A6102|nr:hypothetical protein [Bacillus velezensis]MCX2884792.1 hypothetical protein [Bacillus velezensis]
MKHIIIRRSDLGDFPAMLFYKHFAVSGEDGQVHLYQVLKRKDGKYDSIHSVFLAEDIKYKNLRSLTNAVIDKLLSTRLWDVLIDNRELVTPEGYQILDKNKVY